MARKGFIYKITSPSGKIYIGQTIDLKRRFKKYENLHCKSQSKIYNSILKYGFENHKLEIICECNINELNEKERYYQDFYNCIDKGLNCIYTKTKDKSGYSSLETRNRISKSNIGKEISEATKLKMRESHKNRDCNHSEETKQKLRNKLVSKEARLNLSNNQWKKKIIIDLNTGVFYYSARELSDLIGIKRTTLTSRLSGQNKNSTQYKYI